MRRRGAARLQSTHLTREQEESGCGFVQEVVDFVGVEELLVVFACFLEGIFERKCGMSRI